MTQLNNTIQTLFDSLCEVLSDEFTQDLKLQLDSYSSTISEAHAKNEFLDISLSDSLYKVSHKLLEVYEEYTESNQYLIIGAIRYFIEDEDADGDLDGPCGFDDDVEVMNYVLDVIGKPEWKIEL